MINASNWQAWMSDALQASDIVLTWATPGVGSADVELRFALSGHPVTARFQVKTWDTVKPSTVQRLTELHHGEAPLLVVANRLTVGTVTKLREGRYSWLSRQPLGSGLRGELRVDDRVYPLVERPSDDASSPKAGPGRPGRAAGRIVQALFYRGEATQRELVVATGVSQARVSQVLTRLPCDVGVEHVAGRPGRWRVVDPDRLLSAWLSWYLPEGRITSYWYSLATVHDQAKHAVAALGGRGRVSGDVAADILAPWALPQRALIYADEAGDLSQARFVPSPMADATLELVTTRDPAVTPSVYAEPFLAAAATTRLPLADPLVVLWDLNHATRVDADQAARHLRFRLAEQWRDLHHA